MAWEPETAFIGDGVEGLLRTLADLPPTLIYLVIGVGAALENIFPPVPADTFVLLGAFLATSGRASPWLVFLVTWLANVSTALVVYAMARRYGRSFFATPVGRWLLQPRQLEQINRFYMHWGVPAIFFSRFLPAFRAVVPVFAGVIHLPLRRVFFPLAAASALWYGTLVIIGAIAGRNWQALLNAVGRVNSMLALVALALLGALLAWWWRTRRRK